MKELGVGTQDKVGAYQFQYSSVGPNFALEALESAQNLRRFGIQVDMVYRGKPSASCDSCRQRRIKVCLVGTFSWRIDTSALPPGLATGSSSTTL